MIDCVISKFSKYIPWDTRTVSPSWAELIADCIVGYCSEGTLKISENKNEFKKKYYNRNIKHRLNLNDILQKCN